MTRISWAMAVVVGLAASLTALPALASGKDEAAIRALETKFAAAFNAKDLDAIMKVYVPDASLLVFDVVPPRQYAGADAYRKDWQGLLGLFPGSLKFEISDLHVFAAGALAYGYSIQHLSGADAKGQMIDLTVRVTDVYRKIKGHWLVVHEHVSVPVDLATGKPDLASKP